MAIPVTSARWVISGTSPFGEIWSTGFWTYGWAPTDQTEMEAGLSSVATAYQGNLEAELKSWISPDATIDRLDGYAYPTGGTVATFQAGADFSPAVAGTGAATVQPLQVCAVATLLTGRPGRSYRGRMYIPAYGKALLNHQFTATTIQDLATAVAAMCTAIAADTDFGGEVVVMSQTKSVGTAVTSIRVDSRADIQRRRANQQTGTISRAHDV